MQTYWIHVLCAVAAYFLGAVPFGFLIARSRGVDIRAVGSGNIGATNVFRSVGEGLGILTFALDVAKGFCGGWLIPLLVWRLAQRPGIPPVTLKLLGGALAVIGHNWPVFLGFRGGKGVATSVGLLLGLAPLGCTVGLGVWLVVFLLSGYVSLASIAAAGTLGIVAWPLYLGARGVLLPAALSVLAALAIWRHKRNIQRLLAGTESRFRRRRTPSPRE